MTAEEVLRRIYIGIWLGNTIEEIKEDLEREVGKPLNSEMIAMIRDTKEDYLEAKSFRQSRLMPDGIVRE